MSMRSNVKIQLTFDGVASSQLLLLALAALLPIQYLQLVVSLIQVHAIVLAFRRQIDEVQSLLMALGQGH